MVPACFGSLKLIENHDGAGARHAGSLVLCMLLWEQDHSATYCIGEALDVDHCLDHSWVTVHAAVDEAAIHLQLHDPVRQGTAPTRRAPLFWRGPWAKHGFPFLMGTVHPIFPLRHAIRDPLTTYQHLVPRALPSPSLRANTLSPGACASISVGSCPIRGRRHHYIRPGGNPKSCNTHWRMVGVNGYCFRYSWVSGTKVMSHLRRINRTFATSFRVTGCMPCAARD